MKQIHMDNAEHGEALQAMVDPNIPFVPGYDRCISITREGKLLGGVIYNNYRERSIQMHVAAFVTDWGNRDMLWNCFRYPFVTLGVERIFGMVPSTNEHALQFDLRLGFVEHTRLKGAIPGGDLVVLSMDRHQCRWLALPRRKI